MTTKICGRCKQEKSLDSFGWHKSRNRHNCYCKTCRVEYNKLDSKKHKDRVKSSQKKTKLKAKYSACCNKRQGMKRF